MDAQLDLFAQDADAEFIARWRLFDSPSPHRYCSPPRVCYGLVSHRLGFLRRTGQHREAAELAIAGGIRVCGGDMHWTLLYPYPKEQEK